MPTDDQVEHYMDRVRTIVGQHGWMIQAVGASDNEPAFCYTVGLSDYDHPEFIMFGLPFEVSAHLLNDLGERVRGAVKFTDGAIVEDLLKDYPVYLMEVTDPSQHLNVAHAYAEGPVKALQVVWPDSEQRFPWDPGYPAEYQVIPLLGVSP
jgi:hypothetical protein